MKNSVTHFRTALIVSAVSVGLGAGSVELYAADSTAPVAHSDTAGAAMGDAVTTTRIKAHLMGKKMLSDSDIDVTTTNGVVTLTGHASSPKAMAYAVKEVGTVEGVKSVDNNLTVGSRSKTSAKLYKAADTANQAVTDSVLTTRVKSAMLADSVSKGTDVNVETTDGVVVLKGTLPDQPAIRHAQEIAQNVTGVKSVDISGLATAK